jgi:hypothetical protein
MAVKSSKKWVLPVLVLVAVMVWGHNAYRVVRDIQQSDTFDRANGQQTKPLALKIDTTWMNKTYPPSGRDPFQWYHPESVTKQVQHRKQTAKKQVPDPPNIRFIGMVCDDHGELAVLEWPENQVHFVRPGQQINSITIDRIGDDKLYYIYQQKRYELEMGGGS